MPVKEEGKITAEPCTCSKKKCCHGCGKALGGFFFGLGIALLGYFSQKGMVTSVNILKSGGCVSSKGLVTRRLKCDRAEWYIKFSASGNDLDELVKVATERRDQVLTFLRNQSIPTEEISMGKAYIEKIDRHANFQKTKWNTELPKNRYAVTWRFDVSTRNVDKVVDASTKFAAYSDQFPTNGDCQLEQYVDYQLDDLEIYREEMIGAAAESGRKIARKIVGDSGRLGRLIRADQGTIHYAGYGKPYRDAELVSYFTFEILPK